MRIYTLWMMMSPDLCFAHTAGLTYCKQTPHTAAESLSV